MRTPKLGVALSPLSCVVNSAYLLLLQRLLWMVVSSQKTVFPKCSLFVLILTGLLQFLQEVGREEEEGGKGLIAANDPWEEMSCWNCILLLHVPFSIWETSMRRSQGLP